ncbi:hypothetical protein BT96DRAFT_1018991 [Gymnopus androsaceus JB14]|uniref:Uncharacterized protein n=1 Tax=Gymnopus androsaceus JB14 TaxID=1447944 RepID=A0A6A4HT89_9AGAR|nr:hypothetical protein BT96DRAFT_1018991 [Gymnopus androsaceus JB14]
MSLSRLHRSKVVLRTFRQAFHCTTSSPFSKPGKNQIRQPDSTPREPKSKHRPNVSPIDPLMAPSPSPAFLEKRQMQHLVYLEAQSSRRPSDVIRMNAARDLARSYDVVQDFRKAGQIATAAIYAAIDDDSREKEFSDAFKDSGLLCKDEENIDWSKLDKFFESEKLSVT